MDIKQANRLSKLPPYLFAELDEMCEKVAARGVELIDLGVGDPDLPTPKHIVKKLQEMVEDKSTHRYPSYAGMIAYRKAVALYMKNRFGAKLDPAKEIVALIGSKEGIAHFPLAFINPGDVALVPDPAYPVYHIGTLFAGGESHFMPLKKENGFLPDLDAIPADVLARAKVIYINYPNNPTAACADLPFYEKVVAFAKQHNLIVLSDAAYCEMGFDGYRPLSILEVPGAMDVAIEFHSLSKTFNMTGWRIGFACGNREIVGGLGRIKTNVDSGAFEAIQYAAIEALNGDWAPVRKNMAIYEKRREAAVSGLRALGFDVNNPKASFYIWFCVPKGLSSKEFAGRILEETGVVLTPGVGFGPSGEGYARMALTLPTERIKQAIDRISTVKF